MLGIERSLAILRRRVTFGRRAALGRRLGWLAAMALVSAPACQDDLLQTAVAPPPGGVGGTGGGEGGAPPSGLLDCIAEPASDALPPGAAFGEGNTVSSSPFVLTSYEALEGPGVYVAARDTFRLYVDGQLLAESKGARASLFVPLTLTPGEHSLALAVHAGSGTPAALVHVDELERAHVSGTSWRVSAAPESGWQSASFDDSGWQTATDLGAYGDLPGCDPTSSFPVSTTGRWIGSSEETESPIALRTTLRIAAVGYAEAVTGGGSAAPTLVADYAALEALAGGDAPAVLLLGEGVRDFRRTGADVDAAEVCPSACSEDPSRLTYQALTTDQTCAEALVTRDLDERTLRVGSNKTIVGLGRGAQVRGVSFDLGSSQNVIVRNLAIYDVNPGVLEAGDAFTLTSPNGVWLDHLTVQAISDAFIDAHPGTAGVTLSYSSFDGTNDGECGGKERWMTTFTDTVMNVHHTRFDQASTRSPLATGSLSRLHLWNSVLSNTDDWALGSACSAEVLVERSVFANTEAATRVSNCSDDTGRGRFGAAGHDNEYRDGSDVFLGGDGSEPSDEVFTPPYEYTMEPTADVLNTVLSRARAGGPWALPLALD